jgi:hypothetical protein
VTIRTTKTIPGVDVYIIDKAQFVEIYRSVATSRQSALGTKEEALAYFQGPGLLPGQDPALVSVELLTNTWESYTIPSAKFFEDAAAGGWLYHIEVGAPSTIYTYQDTADVIFNIKKLYADLEKGPDGKKPATLTFRIDAPNKKPPPAGKGGKLEWKIGASVFKSTLTKPPDGPKDDERRDYPVEDKLVPVSGIPGEFDHEYLSPTFPFPEEKAENKDIHTTGENFVEVKLTFGSAKEAPSVEIVDHMGTGGVG